MRVGGAGEEVVQDAVADRGDRARAHLPITVAGEDQPGAAEVEAAPQVLGAEEVAIGGLGVSHRLLVELVEGE